MHILGISGYYHDSAACLVHDGRIAAAAQEERFTRLKGESGFPHHAVAWCLRRGDITVGDLDHIIFYEKPPLKFHRLITSCLVTAPAGVKSFMSAMPSWLTSKIWMQDLIRRELGTAKSVSCIEHHLSHAASAFYPSPFETAAILTIDGVGEWATATYGRGSGASISLIGQLDYPNSLGLLYSAFTAYTGFKINSGEYKLMGLAPYGAPVYADLIREHLIHVNDDGSLLLNQRYFGYNTGLRMTNSRFHRLFGRAPRKPESPITRFEMDVAASIQTVVDEIVVKMAEHVRNRTGMNQLVMAGGVALNCVANGRLSEKGIFDRIWIQPASGDAGGAMGAALWGWHVLAGRPRVVEKNDALRGSLLGPEIRPVSEVDDKILLSMGACWQSLDDDELAAKAAGAVASGEVIAVARGPMEWGPRALGNRSILGDPRLPDMQSRMNLKIKYRESFRPFAPVVLKEDAPSYFSMHGESPYMLFTFQVAPGQRIGHGGPEGEGLERLKKLRSTIPAVTHVDCSARVQTVDAVRSQFLHSLLSRFKEHTGCPVLINTSFNIRGEPIVESASDAYRCFMSTDIDCCIIGNRFLRKADQNLERWEPEKKRISRGAALIDNDAYLDALAYRRWIEDRKRRINFGLFVGVLFSGVGGFNLFFGTMMDDTVSAALLVAGILALLLTLVVPQVFAAPERLLFMFLNKTGSIALHLVLIVSYFLVVTPFGYFFRRSWNASAFIAWDKHPSALPTTSWSAAVQDDECRRPRGGSIASIAFETVAVFRKRKSWLAIPVVMFLLALAAVFFFVQSSVLAPFIYTLF